MNPSLDMNLSRNRNTGKIFNDPTGGTPEDKRVVVLQGGFYPLFEKNKTVWRGLARPGENTPFIVRYGKDQNNVPVPPCARNPASCPTANADHRARVLTWRNDDNWDELFDLLHNNGCNLLRVWVMGGTAIHPPGGSTGPFDLYPFVAARVGTQWKWKVYDAVGVKEQDAVWNADFFARLVLFVDKANEYGICVQLTLFNYFDFDDLDLDTFKAWSASPWNPEMSIDPTKDWGTQNLVSGRTRAERIKHFIRSNPNLRVVQKRFVRKIVSSLMGRNNVIFELMNEPRDASAEEMSRFNSEMVAAIDEAAGQDWKPLVSVNASQLPGQPGTTGIEFDTDWWRINSGTVGRYDRVDIISYHALTGYDSYLQVQGCTDVLPPGKTLSVPRTDPDSIRLRVNRHKNTQRDGDKKALMFSTDAALVSANVDENDEEQKKHKYPFEHKYCVGNTGNMVSMNVRDGQIDTSHNASTLDSAADLTPEEVARLETAAVTVEQRQTALKSDLKDWAFWCFRQALANRALIHFQNHSSFEFGFRKISEAWRQAGGSVQ